MCMAVKWESRGSFKLRAHVRAPCMSSNLFLSFYKIQLKD